jgi:ribosomal protein S18 acetylase RimI-like enzyme
MPTIRCAQVADAVDLAALVEEYWAFERIGGFDRARVEKSLRTLAAEPGRGACWIAEHRGATAGYLIAVYMLSLEFGGIAAEIDEFFVRPAWRGTGVGAALLGECEREMRRAGIVRVQLQLAVANERARGFYRQHGFQQRSGYELLDKPLASLDRPA